MPPKNRYRSAEPPGDQSVRDPAGRHRTGNNPTGSDLSLGETRGADTRGAGLSRATRPSAIEPLDEIDRALLRELARDGRISNVALADAVGIAPSTCLTRVRTLRQRGVIRGYHADVDLALIGYPIQALVAVRLVAHTREVIERFREAAPRLPGVLGIYHVSGVNDYVLRIAVRNTEELRDFVLDHLTSNPAVTHAETSLIFEHLRGQTLPGLGQ